ncbi:hypothetical protein HTZ84_11555 [Haloterrigena sp. SYSU A558-1]|uniref:Uncharacterized protein n=1 Tax=Haloterrigena gelatinilytica TaxID=2741724 RepID=A0A8J8GNY8_9EURY|nr:hypothetical protein [Haloterrigena gelatinilytica]NUB91322.1 hypothetical protein [Haloterrigena gelatinilytica]NUC72939.1 hypothetical protein [Haloterrigena gelatinilytica]
MPIDNETFQRGRKEQNIEEEVREFLASHEQQAFSVPEIAAEICEPTLSTTEESESETLSEYQLDIIAVKVSLIDLYRRGAIETRVIDDGKGTRKYYQAIR